jgi:hypothetical protein
MNADGISGLVPQGDFHAVNSVDRGITGRGFAQDGDYGPRDEAKMHQVVLYRFRKIESYQLTALPYVQLTEYTHLTNSDRLLYDEQP